MRNFFYILLAGILFLGSCQDPLISFNKDKNYLCRQWKLEAGKDTMRTYVLDDTIIVYHTYTSDSMFQEIAGYPGVLRYAFSETITFNDDYTFTASVTQNYENIPMNSSSSGTWEFLGKDENYKKNQQLVLYYTTTSDAAGTNSVAINDTIIITGLSKEKLSIKNSNTQVKNGDSVSIIQEKNYVAIEE